MTRTRVLRLFRIAVSVLFGILLPAAPVAQLLAEWRYRDTPVMCCGYLKDRTLKRAPLALALLGRGWRRFIFL